MNVGDIKKILDHFPDTMPVNVFIEYRTGVILRAPGVQINYVDNAGVITTKPTDIVNEIGFYIVEALLNIKRINNSHE